MKFNDPPRTGYGYIYILSNPSMQGIYKIGLTRNSVDQRINELTSTGVPTRFSPERIFEIEERFLASVEQAIHRELRSKGLHHGKEFFKASLRDCITCVEDVIYRTTDAQSKDLVGEAKAREDRKRLKAEWERLDEDRRYEELRRINDEVRLKRDKWLASQPPITDGGDLLMWIGFLALGTLYLGALIGAAPALIVGGLIGLWLYSEDKSKKGKLEDKVKKDLDTHYPFKEISDIPKRDYEKATSGTPHATAGQAIDSRRFTIKEEVRNKGTLFSASKDSQVSKSVPSKRAFPDPYAAPPSEHKVVESKRQAGRSNQLQTKRFYKNLSGIGDKRSPWFSSFNVLKRSMLPEGYTSDEFGFINEYNIETLARHGDYIISSCPECGNFCSAAVFKEVSFKCSCQFKWNQRLE